VLEDLPPIEDPPLEEFHTTGVHNQPCVLLEKPEDKLLDGFVPQADFNPVNRYIIALQAKVSNVLGK